MTTPKTSNKHVFFKIGGSSHMRRSELRSEGAAFSGCFTVFRAQENEGKKMQNNVSRKKKW